MAPLRLLHPLFVLVAIRTCAHACWGCVQRTYPHPFDRYELLAENEAQAVPWRLQSLEQEVQQLSNREADLQAKFQLLIDERDVLYSVAAKANLAKATVSRPALTA